MTEYRFFVQARHRTGFIQRLLVAAARRGCDVTAMEANTAKGITTVRLATWGRAPAHVLKKTFATLPEVDQVEETE